MNANRLLAHYERIADAPDVISRMRRFILDLAVRGKLVEQDPEEEPASELLERIARETSEQTRLPKSWRRARVGTLLDFQYGKGLKASERLDEGPTPVFGSNGIVGFTHEPLTVRPSIIVGRKGSAGALNLCDRPSWTTDVAYFVEAPSFFTIRFLANALAALDLDKLGKGVKLGLSRSDAYEKILNVPPLAEQHRIAAKVDELMALCDRLEAARAEREATRDRLTAASLVRLDAPDPDPAIFRVHAAFALENIAPLTTRLDQIKALRQTILNLAVRGKLVEQDPTDEPASELLKRIAETQPKKKRAKSVASERGDANNNLGSAIAALGWTKVWLDALSIFENGDRSSNYPSGPDIKSEGIPFFNTKNLSDYRLRFTDLDFITQEKFDSLRSGRLQDLDILITLRGSVGKFGLFKATEHITTGFINAQLLIIRCLELEIVLYIVTFMKSDDFAKQISLLSSGAATPQLSAGKLAEVLITLPPLAEQRRIVAKVDELMALCDRLEESIITGNDACRRLFDALLAEALAPAQAREIKAAE